MEMLNIIIPMYNHGKYIKDCLESIYNNKSPIKLDITLVDDCSTDDSYEVATKVISEFKKTDKYIETKLIKTPNNLHLSGARNYGIKNSKGTLVLCIDADDMIPPNYIEEHYNNIIENNVDVSYSNSRCFGSSIVIYNWPEYDVELLKNSPFINCSAMHNRAIWEAVGGFDENMKLGWEDYDYWLSAAKNGFKMRKCDTTYLAYRRSEDSMVESTDKPENQKIIREYLSEKHKDFYKGYI